MATENVRRAVAMKNRQCLNNMADYVSLQEKKSIATANVEVGIGDQLDKDVGTWNGSKRLYIFGA